MEEEIKTEQFADEPCCEAPEQAEQQGINGCAKDVDPFDLYDPTKDDADLFSCEDCPDLVEDVPKDAICSKLKKLIPLLGIIIGILTAAAAVILLLKRKKK